MDIPPVHDAHDALLAAQHTLPSDAALSLSSSACEEDSNAWRTHIDKCTQHMDLQTLIDTLFLSRPFSTLVELYLDPG